MEKNPHLSTTDIFTPNLEKPVSLAHNMINEGNKSGYLTKLTSFIRSHKLFFLFGITSELVYLFYLLRSFPLTHYFQSGKSDMGSMSGYTYSGFLTFVIIFSFLFVMFGLAWWEAFKFQDRNTLWIILSFGATFTLTTIFVYPITALDLFFYIVRSLVMVQ